LDGGAREDGMEDTLRTKWTLGGAYRKKSVEVRLLYVACLCFIVAQYVVNEHPWNSGFRIVALLAMISAQFIGFRTRKV
jgi:5'-deoxynucleotidase YfbR-like HD superfamily hydrolase